MCVDGKINNERKIVLTQISESDSCKTFVVVPFIGAGNESVTLTPISV